MSTNTEFREERNLLVTVTADAISELEVVHGSDVHKKKESVLFASNFILQSHCDVDCYISEIDNNIEIKGEPLWLESASSGVKCESEVTPDSDIHYESGSVLSHSSSHSDCDTDSDVIEINSNIEIKEEPVYLEITFPEVKSEQEEIHSKDLDYSFNREDDPLEETQELTVTTRLDTTAVGVYGFGVASTDLVNDCLNPAEHRNSHHEKSNTAIALGGYSTQIQICKFCSSVINLASGFQTGVKRKDVCNICDKIYPQAVHLKEHNVINAVKKSHKCNQCDKCFTEKSNLNRHLLVHEGRKPYKCSYCDKNFATAVCFKIHELVHEGKSPYKCDYCEKSFSSAAYLKHHKLFHEGKRLHKCDRCDRSFITNSALKQHILIHEGIKPYKCNQCEKYFTHKSNFKRHISCHEGRKRYKCSYCDKKYTTAYCLKIHKLVHEGKSPYKCNYCEKNLSSSSSLENHKSLHEGKVLL